MISPISGNPLLSGRQNAGIAALTTANLETVAYQAIKGSSLSPASIPGLMFQFLLRKDNSLSFLFLNPNFGNFFEIEAGVMDVDTETLVSMIHPDDRDYFYDSISNSAEALESWNWLGRFILPSGKIKWVQWDAQPSRQANGNIFWNGLLVDVTCQQKLNEEVEKLSFLLNLTERLQSSSDLYEIASFTLNYLIQATNASFGDVKVIQRYDQNWEPFCLINYVSAQLIAGCSEQVVEQIIAALQKSANHDRELLQKVVENATILVIEDDSSHLKCAIDRCELPWGQIIMFPIPATDGTVLGVLTLHFDHYSEGIQNSRLKEMVLAACRILGARMEQAKAREELQQANIQLESAYEQLSQQTQSLEKTLSELQQTQAQLIQSEKMSSLGNLVAGIAHEINNPVGFIHGNLPFAAKYFQDLLLLLESYHKYCPESRPEIEQLIEEIDLSYLREDLPRILASIQTGSERIRDIVRCLRNFSRLDESELKQVNIHDGIENTLLLLNNRLKAQHCRPEIEVIKHYGNLPKIECYPGSLNQVFMNIISNAIDALEESFATGYLNSKKNKGQICIRTEVISGEISIAICDNGFGIPASLQDRLFDPFFTTKPVGKGTGLGLSISYRIVTEKHGGQLKCISAPGQNTEFVIKIPVKQINICPKWPHGEEIPA
ncbi:MAG TPA: ATP-binding protein [Halomicronema sp.]